MRAWILWTAIALSACADHGKEPALSNRPPSLNVADTALASGAPAIALQVANGILASAPGNVAALVRQGNALAALGRGGEADLSYQRALAIDPASGEAMIGEGRLLLADRPAQAEELFLRVVSADPRNAVALNDLGIARDMQGRHSQAQEAYRRAMACAPGMVAAQVNLGLSLAISGETTGAIALLRPLAADAEAPKRVRHDLAVALTLAGQRDEAVRVLSVDMPADEASRLVDDIAALYPRNTEAPPP